MIKYVIHENIDKKRWDDCIKESFNGLIYGYSWYLDIVAENWNGLIEDDYQAVFPLIAGKKFAISYLYQPKFTQQLGVYSKKHLTQEKVDNFIAAIPSHYKFAEFNLNTHNKSTGKNVVLTPNKNHELDLIDTYVNIKKGYSQNTRRNIKKAVEEKVQIDQNIKPDDIINLFRLNKGKNIKQLVEADYRTLGRLVYSSQYKGKAQIMGAYTQFNELCAGAIFLKSHNRAIFLFSATSDLAKQNGAMSLLIDTFIKQNAGKPITLDFEGSNDPNLARFYKSFGSTETMYNQLSFNRLPFITRFAVNMIKKVRSGLRGY